MSLFGLNLGVGYTIITKNCSKPVTWQELIEKNSLNVGNVNMSTARYILGYYTLYRLLTLGVNSILIYFFVYDYNINHYNTLKTKKKLFLFVFLSVFVTLIDLGAQIRGAQTWCTVVNFGLNQPLPGRIL